MNSRFFKARDFDEVDKIEIIGKRFHLSGKFDGYLKKDFAEKILVLGGNCLYKGDIALTKTDYLVIGGIGYNKDQESKKQKKVNEHNKNKLNKKILTLSQSHCENLLNKYNHSLLS